LEHLGDLVEGPGGILTQTAELVGKPSTYSGMNGCLEVAFINGQVVIRDSKDKQGPVLLFTSAEWENFLRGAVEGEFGFSR
jgi:Domain of unknown function (DUF397)